VSVVFVHGLPETSAIWQPLREILDRETTAVALPGFAAPRPDGFTATKDAYAEWLAQTLAQVEPPVDVVGHDLGALLLLRVASAFDVPLRSWTVDVADLFHPHCAWEKRVRDLQTPGVGEEMLKRERMADPDDPHSTVARLVAAGVPPTLAGSLGAAHDEVMSQSILDFYRSAVPNVSAGWWQDITGPTRSRGLVLLLPHPPDHEAMSLEVADTLGAQTARLDDLDHCWMAQAPRVVAPVLERFWGLTRLSPADLCAARSTPSLLTTREQADGG
jgi:pimeloyl-ACP methyl ester carboxylesterase